MMKCYKQHGREQKKYGGSDQKEKRRDAKISRKTKLDTDRASYKVG